MRPLHRVLVLALATTATVGTPSPGAAAIPVPTAARAAFNCQSYAGERITRPGYPTYLVDPWGSKRGIQHWSTSDALFTAGAPVRMDIPLEICPDGEVLSLDAHLISAPGGRPTYLYTNRKKYGITSGHIMRKYHFDPAKIRLVAGSVLDDIEDGGYWE